MVRRFAGILIDVALIGLVATVIVTAAVGPIAAAFGRSAFVVGGGSMSPTIAKGTMVILEPTTEARPLQPGDVASFRTRQNVAVTHRVMRVVERPDGTWFETKGDANAHPDPSLWPASSVVGRVTLSVPVLGFTSWLFRHPIGWLNVVVLVGWLLFARRIVRGSDPVSGDTSAGFDRRTARPQGAEALTTRAQA